MNDLAFPIRCPLRRVEPGVVLKMTVSDLAPSCEFATHPTFKVIFIVVIIIHHLSSIRVLDEIFSYHISNFNESLHHLLIVLVSNQVDGVIFCYSSFFRGDG